MSDLWWDKKREERREMKGGWFWLLLLFWALIGCGQPIGSQVTFIETETATAVLEPTPTLRVSTEVVQATSVSTSLPEATAVTVPSEAAVADTGWDSLQTGLEKRVIRLEPIVSTTGSNRGAEIVYMLRVDPAHFLFDVGYAAGNPKLLAEWQAESGAQIVVNGGFFTPEQTATALVIDDNQVIGSSYVGFGGMIGIDAAGVTLLDLARQPYTGGEGFAEGMQSFPMLVLPGGELGFPADLESGRVARRTVIGIDQTGRVLLIITPRGAFTLHQLSRYLVESDFELDMALNLDGGPSSGILLQNAAGVEGYAAYTAVPLVLLVRPRVE